MENGLITIIVPIYNVEKYLERCIESIVNQTYTNLEIVLIDDGSTDKCAEICDEWRKKDRRIKVVHKKNEGLGMARNSGIENATGEYIYFVDSDDYIDLDTIEKCYRMARREEADLVTFGFYRVYSNGRLGKSSIPSLEKYIFEGEEVLGVFLPNLIAPDIENGTATNLWMSACSSFCRLDIIKEYGWKFVSEREIISEDIFSLLQLYKVVHKVVVIPEAFYYYCENMSSLTHSYRKDRFDQIKYFYDRCIDECEILEYSQDIKKGLAYPYISNTIAALKMIAIADCSEGEKKQAIEMILSDQHLRKVIILMNLKKEKLTRKMFLLLVKYRKYSWCRKLICQWSRKNRG